MARYAANTQVSVEKSKGEIERILRRYGADGFGHYTKGDRAFVAFEMEGRPFRIDLPMPDPNASVFTHTATRNRARDPEARDREYEKACRQRWRAICLMLKAKLEAVDIGVSSLDGEFMPYMVLPGGQTIAEKMLPHLDKIAASGNVHKFLPEPEEE